MTPAAWTKTNFTEIEDRSPDGEPMGWFFSRKELGSEELGVSLFRFEPNSRMPFGHRHEVQEEIYVVVGGSGTLKLDDEHLEVARWDAIRVSPHVGRGFEAGPEGLEVICVGGSRPDGGDGAPVPGFWD